MSSDAAVTVLRIILIIALLAAVATFAHAATCVYKTNDVGTITAEGIDKEAAFSEAALQCFNRRLKYYRLFRGQPDSDTMMTMIDICANLKCEK